MTSVLRPHAPVAERVLLPGDPGRALRLAQQLLEGPKMVNHHRGLWGYSGEAADGCPMTIQSTGLGGPSAAAVVADLIALGARRLVRVGTADAPRGGVALGGLVVAETVLPGDGASRALGAEGPLVADATLLGALRAAAGLDVRAGLVASTDLLPEHDPSGRWPDVEAVDLTSAAVLAAAARGGAAAASVLGISGVLGDGDRLEPQALEALEAQLGRVGAAALMPGQ
jgi:uridine phosphorylase